MNSPAYGTLVLIQAFKAWRGWLQGRSQDFSKGGGGHTVSNIIVIAFSPRNIIGCFLKKRLTKGGSQAPQDPPSLRPWVVKLCASES